MPILNGRDPDDWPSPPNPPPAQLPGLGVFLRKRYTCNVAVTEMVSANDLIHDVIFRSSRLFFTQAANGKISLKNKKPATYAFATATWAVGATIIALDNVREWIGNATGWLLISPHSVRSEVRTVSGAAYATNQNTIVCSNTGGLLTTPNFAGYVAPSTPATTTITVNAATADTACTVTIDGVEFNFRTATSGETTVTIASFIAGTIAAHPSLHRRFDVTYVTGASTVLLTARTGTLGIDAAIFRVVPPLVDPTVAPTLSSSGTSTTFAAGEYAVSYSYVNLRDNETLLSPYKKITITATQLITVAAITPPADVVSVKWYVTPQNDSGKMRYLSTNSGAAFNITVLPLLTAPLPPDLNRTGAEVMRVSAVFSDRRLTTRSSAQKSNVLEATFEWLLGNREKSVNRIDLKYRDASQDWRLIDLRIRDDAHIAKVKKTLPQEYNGQAIDNTDQAYRIAAGLLAEKRDADFFYQWKATREALLLQEGDVVAITDHGSGVINLPVIIEQIEFDVPTGALPFASFTARKYASSLYDDSIVERTIPVLAES